MTLLLDGLPISLDSALSKGWYRARYRRPDDPLVERMELFVFSDRVALPRGTHAIDVGAEDLAVLREHFLSDDDLLGHVQSTEVAA